MNNIHQNGVLAALSISLPPDAITDKQVTREVNSAKGASANAGRYRKKLYPQPAVEEGKKGSHALFPISQLAGAARRWHKAHTLVFEEDEAEGQGEHENEGHVESDEGGNVRKRKPRYVTAAMMPKYERMLVDEENPDGFPCRFRQLAEKFTANFEMHKSVAATCLGAMFEEKDYPKSADALRSLFRFKAEFTPVATGADFHRTCLSKATADRIEADFDRRLEEAVEAGRSDLWKRLIDPLRHMVERLSQPKPRIYDTLTGNIREIVQLIPRLNVTDDAQLAAFTAEIEQHLGSWDPERFRDSMFARQDAAKQGTELLRRYASLGERRFEMAEAA